jgi:sensitive to high expression protein 9
VDLRVSPIFHLSTSPALNVKASTEMRPLLQHASRSLAAKPASIAPSRLAGRVVSQSPTICLRCQYRAASTSVRNSKKARKSLGPLAIWPQRSFSGATRWLEERRPPTFDNPVPPSSPASRSRPAAEDRLDERTSNIMASFAAQKRLQEANARIEEEEKTAGRPPDVVNVAKEPVGSQAHEPPNTQNKSAVADNVARVPDEHLPSHRERQRWDLSKRLSDLMDDMLPKLAVVTQKVNTYTGTDYSGVEALRQEIKEQGEQCNACI